MGNFERWIAAVTDGTTSRAYPWSYLAGEKLIQDQLGDLPLALHLSADGVSLRGWDRRLDGRELDLRFDEETDRLVDDISGSAFGFDGVANGGELEGQALRPLAVSVEYLHSYESFNGGEIFGAPSGGTEGATAQGENQDDSAAADSTTAGNTTAGNTTAGNTTADTTESALDPVPSSD